MAPLMEPWLLEEVVAPGLVVDRSAGGSSGGCGGQKPGGPGGSFGYPAHPLKKKLW